MSVNGTYKQPPTRSGLSDGEVVEGCSNTSTGKKCQKWKWNSEAETWQADNGLFDFEGRDNDRIRQRIEYNLTGFPPQKENYSTAALRYPRQQDGGITVDSDYVLFHFHNYNPPFGKRKKGQNPSLSALETVDNLFNGEYQYNQATEYVEADKGEFPVICMYMPEDVSTGFQAQWSAQNVSTVGSNILKAAGAEGFDKLTDGLGAIKQQAEKTLQIAGVAALKKTISAIGGDSLSNNDIFGGISGAILNPNTELLFGGIDVRNFQLTFKLVPRSPEEATDCNKIVHTFKMATLPQRSPGTDGKVFGFSNSSIATAFIGTPKLVRVSFMHGSAEHDVLPRFKMCAITAVDVNYTPDGAYATYTDGQPVAMELKLSFQETKICFADEVRSGDVR